MKVISIVAGRQHLMKVNSLHKDLISSNIDHSIIDVGVYYQQFAKFTYEELCLPDPLIKLTRELKLPYLEDIQNISVKLMKIFSNLTPDVILVYGDITPSVSACYAAMATNIPIAHVEAGLRNNDLNDIEELNRLLIDRFSSLLFVTGKQPQNNLLREGNNENSIYIVGNSIIDSLKDTIKYKDESILRTLNLANGDFSLVTYHRKENLESETAIQEFIASLEELSEKIPLVFIQYPDTQKAFSKLGLQQYLNNIPNLIILNTVSYRKYLGLLDACNFIITDSSGIQDEAAYLGKPCIVCREHSHRVDALESPTHTIVGNNSIDIVSAALNILKNPSVENKYPKEWDFDIGKKISLILAENYE